MKSNANHPKETPIMCRVERRKQQKIQSRQPKKHDRNAIARYYGTPLDLQLTNQLRECFDPIVNFLQALLSGEGVSVNDKGYPVLEYSFDDEPDVSNASGAINLVLEMVWQCLYISGQENKDFEQALLIINRKLSKKLDYGCPVERKDTQFALDVVVKSRDWVVASDQNVVCTVVNKIKQAHKDCIKEGGNFSVGHCRKWLIKNNKEK